MADRLPVSQDTNNAPESERETAAKQNEPRTSTTLDDPQVDASQVVSLPGVGGIDDAGDIEVDPDELHVPRRPNATK